MKQGGTFFLVLLEEFLKLCFSPNINVLIDFVIISKILKLFSRIGLLLGFLSKKFLLYNASNISYSSGKKFAESKVVIESNCPVNTHVLIAAGKLVAKSLNSNLTAHLLQRI